MLEDSCYKLTFRFDRKACHLLFEVKILRSVSRIREYLERYA